jgi:hypothetical protein
MSYERHPHSAQALRHAKLASVLLVCATLAHAQLRTIPADAARGTMRHVQENVVEVDGKRETLAPGAQIRDASNRIIVPTALPEGSLVKYRRDRDGAVREIWVLTPDEAQRKP